jgi:signal peptidase I
MRGRTLLVTLIVLLLSFFSPLIAPFMPGFLLPYSSYVFLSILLLIVFIGSPHNFIRLRPNRDSAIAMFIGLLIIFLYLEPFQFTHSILSFPPLLVYVGYIAYSALFSILVQSFVFRMHAMRYLRSSKPRIPLSPLLIMIFLTLNFHSLLDMIYGGPTQLFNFIIYTVFPYAVMYILLIISYTKFNFNDLPPLILFFSFLQIGTIGIRSSVPEIVANAWFFTVIFCSIVVIFLVSRNNRYFRGLFEDKRKIQTAREKKSFYEVLGIIVSILIAYFIILPLVLGTPHPFYGDPSGSMYPKIIPGSLLVVRGVQTQNIAVGDIIVFNAPWNPGLYVAHMVIGIIHNSTGTYFVTKGIANPVKDPTPVPARDVFGEVIVAVPYLGYIVIYEEAIVPLLLIPLIVKLR